MSYSTFNSIISNALTTEYQCWNSAYSSYTQEGYYSILSSHLLTDSTILSAIGSELCYGVDFNYTDSAGNDLTMASGESGVQTYLTAFSIVLEGDKAYASGVSKLFNCSTSDYDGILGYFIPNIPSGSGEFLLSADSAGYMGWTDDFPVEYSTTAETNSFSLRTSVSALLLAIDLPSAEYYTTGQIIIQGPFTWTWSEYTSGSSARPLAITLYAYNGSSWIPIFSPGMNLYYDSATSGIYPCSTQYSCMDVAIPYSAISGNGGELKIAIQEYSNGNSTDLILAADPQTWVVRYWEY